MWWKTGLLLVMLAAAQPAAPATAETAAPAGRPLVEVDGEPLDVDAALRPFAAQILRLESQLYALRRRAVDDAIARRLLEREAARRSTTVEALLAQEVEAKLTPPAEAEVEARVAARKRAGAVTDEELEAARHGIRAALAERQRAELREKLVASLRERARIVVEGLEPPALATPIATEGEPSRGPADAPVTIVEFSDFQCPYCRQVQPTLKALLERYPDKVRLVHRDFPVAQLHPGAQAAAEAARCAGEQGKFWEYGDVLYANPAKQAEADLVHHATALGLDEARFRDCVRSKRHAGAVARGIADGKKVGVVGTPTFFVNGTPLVGARPLAEFQALVERELRRRAATGEERRVAR